MGQFTEPHWYWNGGQDFAQLGTCVSSAGDVNGDGFDDVIIGALGYHNPAGISSAGAVFGFYGSAAGLANAPDWTVYGEQAEGAFGGSISGAGDVDGDGYDDVIVGMHYYDGASANLGAAFIYRGSASGLSRTFDKMMVGHGDFFGYSVSKAGDVNGDGYGDVIVGAHYYDNGTRNEGGAFIYLGSDSGLSRTPVWATESGGLDARYGHSVSTAGDVTHDGRDDVIVGADWLDAAKSQEGRVYLYYGAATVPVQNHRHFAETFKPPVSQAGYISQDLLLLKGFSLSLYDLKGRCVWKSAGSGPAYVDRNIENGTYFSQWTNGRKTARTKILLLR